MKEEQKNTGAQDGGSVASYYDIFLSAAAEFCRQRHIDDFNKVPQNNFTAFCYYINQTCFNSQKLRSNPTLFTETQIVDIGETYLRLCGEFDKVASPWDFAIILGVEESTIFEWYSGNNRESSAPKKQISKKIIAAREQGASAKLLGNSGGQAVGILGYLNHYAGWNAPHMAGDEQQQKSRLSRSEVQQIAARKQDEIVLDLPTIQNTAAKIGNN